MGDVIIREEHRHTEDPALECAAHVMGTKLEKPLPRPGVHSLPLTVSFLHPVFTWLHWSIAWVDAAAMNSPSGPYVVLFAGYN